MNTWALDLVQLLSTGTTRKQLAWAWPTIHGSAVILIGWLLVLLVIVALTVIVIVPVIVDLIVVIVVAVVVLFFLLWRANSTHTVPIFLVLSCDKRVPPKSRKPVSSPHLMHFLASLYWVTHVTYCIFLSLETLSTSGYGCPTWQTSQFSFLQPVGPRPSEE